MPKSSTSIEKEIISVACRISWAVMRATYARVVRTVRTGIEHMLGSAVEIARTLRTICHPVVVDWMIDSSWRPTFGIFRLPPARISSTVKLERDAKKLEAEGKLEEAMSKLHESHSAGSSNAGTLAHEFAQRHPEALQVKVCPIHEGDKSVPNAISSAAEISENVIAPSQPYPSFPLAVPRQSADAASAAAVAAADTDVALPVEFGTVGPREWTTQQTSESGELINSESEPVHVQLESYAITELLPRQELRSGKHPGVKDEEANGHVRSRAATEGTKEGETPWERGWQASELFMPPSECKRPDGAGVGDLASGLRNFTILQLNFFDGGIEKEVERGGMVRAGKTRPIYIALRGIVYDTSAGRHLYGPNGEYSELAGHDVSRRVARGLRQGSSRDDDDLDDLSLEGLSRFEKMTLSGWEDIFVARGYPVVGRVVAIATPTPPRLFSREELRLFDGRRVPVGLEGGFLLPTGYALPSIYVGVMDKVFDVSFGGAELYSEGGAYKCLAGRDASRVLARMSMSPEDVEGFLDYSRLTSKELKNLADWAKRLEDKGYPVVGRIALCSPSNDQEA